MPEVLVGQIWQHFGGSKGRILRVFQVKDEFRVDIQMVNSARILHEYPLTLMDGSVWHLVQDVPPLDVLVEILGF